MSKLSLSELTSTKLSNHLVAAASSIKGGNESQCHPSLDDEIPSSITIEGGLN